MYCSRQNITQDLDVVFGWVSSSEMKASWSLDATFGWTLERRLQ
jgi:hypothetical protein